MGIDRTRGYVQPSGGAYKTPSQSGVVESDQSSPYRNNPKETEADDGRVYNRPPNPGITEIDYIPNGNVYERPVIYEAPEPPDVYIESRLYPVFWSDDMSLAAPSTSGFIWPHADPMTLSTEMLSGTLAPALVTYPNWPDENMRVVNSEITGGTLEVLLEQYLNWQDENMGIDTILTSGTLLDALITYSNLIDESITITSAPILSGTLT